MTTLYIKNMVCNRCVMVVTQELQKLGFHPEKVSLGEVALRESDLGHADLQRIDTILEPLGFERIDDRKGRMVDQIKNKVIEMIHDP